MIPAPATLDALKALPDAIWIAGRRGPAVYRGTPLEMVRTMAAEMGEGVSVSDAVRKLTKALAKSRRLNVKLTTVGLTDEMLARLFVFVLLDTKVGRKMPQA